MTKSETPEKHKEPQGPYTVLAGYKFGFGVFLAFLTGFTILAALSVGIWYGMIAVR